MIGRIRAGAMELVSNCLLLARAAGGDTLPPVYAVRRQTGCVRFTFLPFASLTPRRYRCQPESAEGESGVAPRFTSLRYGVAGLLPALRAAAADEIRRGADDESEMGAFHALFPAAARGQSAGSAAGVSCASGCRPASSTRIEESAS